VGLQEFEMKHKSCSQLVRSVSRDRNSWGVGQIFLVVIGDKVGRESCWMYAQV
jgi:hypothetical protein